VTSRAPILTQSGPALSTSGKTRRASHKGRSSAPDNDTNFDFNPPLQFPRLSQVFVVIGHCHINGLDVMHTLNWQLSSYPVGVNRSGSWVSRCHLSGRHRHTSLSSWCSIGVYLDVTARPETNGLSLTPGNLHQEAGIYRMRDVATQYISSKTNREISSYKQTLPVRSLLLVVKKSRNFQTRAPKQSENVTTTQTSVRGESVRRVVTPRGGVPRLRQQHPEFIFVWERGEKKSDETYYPERVVNTLSIYLILSVENTAVIKELGFMNLFVCSSASEAF
jgi:hypothetical protein